jgi:hypothetical protein
VGAEGNVFVTPDAAALHGVSAIFRQLGTTEQGAARSVKISPAISNTRKGENAGRAFPINLLGGYRWPGRKGVDAELARTIVRIEICAISIVPLIDDGESGEAEGPR